MAKGKYDLSNFKKKIAPRDRDEIEKKAASRFSKADEALGVIEAVEPEKRTETPPPMSRVVRKTFSIPENELGLINLIKDTALDNKVVLAESEIVRLGFLVLSEMKGDEIQALAGRLTKMPMGRPPKK